MTPFDRIKSLINALPEKDIPFAEKFLNYRDYDSLKDLVDSAIIKIRRDLRKTSPKEESLKADMLDLTMLQTEIDSYIILLDGALPVSDDEEYERDKYEEPEEY